MSKWNNKVKRILKSELVKRGITSDSLATLLNNNGCAETKSSIDSKISRGTFSASFFMQCLYVIGCKKIDIDEGIYLELEIKEQSSLIAAESTIQYKSNQDEN